MEINDRQREICKYVMKSGRISVADMSKKLYVSEMTIRRDFAVLEVAGYLRRYRGGALSPGDRADRPIVMRGYEHDAEKRRLAAAGAAYLSDGMSVFLDSSSTVSYLAPHLSAFRGLSVFTNSVRTLLLLAERKLPATILGGEYYIPDMCTVGGEAEFCGGRLNVDLAFFTCLGLAADGRITDLNAPQTRVRQAMMKHAKRSVFLFDSAKVNFVSTYTVCRVGEVFAVITEEGTVGHLPNGQKIPKGRPVPLQMP